MPIKKLLFPTKFRPGALQFLKRLLVLKEVGLEEVTVLHVIEKDKVSYDYAGYLKDLEMKLRNKAEEILREWEREIGEEVRFNGKIIVGIPEYEVIEAEGEVDLVAMGKPTSGILRRLFMGSTALNILAHSRKPSIMAKFEDETLYGERCMFCKVVFATDGSAPCKRALELLKQLAPLIQEVDVVSVVNTKRMESENYYRPILQEAAEALSSSGLKVDTHLLSGTPSKEVVSFAESTGATLIAVGTTGKDALEEMFIGSASHRILEKTRLPVMIVP